jgi:hypothetical protein
VHNACSNHVQRIESFYFYNLRDTTEILSERKSVSITTGITRSLCRTVWRIRGSCRFKKS